MRKKKLSKAQAGRLGGLRTVQLYGVEHMRRIGKKGGETFRRRYAMPAGWTSWGYERNRILDQLAHSSPQEFS